jgi:uncharacterized membrane protein YkvA (DUF1232 family)
VVLWLLAVLVLLGLGRKTLARELITLLPNLLRLFRGLLGDERVPRSTKALLLLGAVWLASPIDLIPEFLPVIGPLDDVVVVALAFRYAARQIPRDVLLDAWPGDRRIIERLIGPARPTAVT